MRFAADLTLSCGVGGDKIRDVGEETER